MFTYFIIGLIVQAVIIVERAIRVPEFFSLLDWKDPMTWVGLAAGICYNTILWPVAIFAEIINIYYGQ